ncbi:MAG: RagB/SusD family nutrient uptake outer membrane protein [Prevotella sp.]|nr:RagB/SusD family nutrient uptake outer membrane protein [Prevotella sp.]
MKKYIGLSIIALSLGMTSCGDYLDKLPDDRAEVNTELKVAQLLVSAYPDNSADLIMEHASDNIQDNGSQYTEQDYQGSMYRWEPVLTISWESPQWIWNSHYFAVATANEALAAISEMGDPVSLNGPKAEALLCRAFAMFRMSNVFCMAYDPTKADQYLGLPYPTEPGVSVEDRGTLEELYEKIDADIEAALPLVSDAHLVSPKYHFNLKAAYAFAARFNLYYHKYDKAIKYATTAIGSNPSAVLRNYAQYMTLAGVDDVNNAYVAASESANLLLVTANSIAGRAQYSSSWRRYACHYDIWQRELSWAPGMPWGSGSSNNTLYMAKLLYGGANQSVYMPFMVEFFAVTDKVANTGTPYIVDVAFSTDEALLVRAEAYVLKKQYTEALQDMNYWVGNHCSEKAGSATRPVLTEELVNSTFDNMEYTPDIVYTATERTPKKHLKPQGFTVEEGTQENMIQMVLHMRRLQTWQRGLRFQDLKRYGIVFSHNIDGSDPIVFQAGDPRGALQIPQDAIKAGVMPNEYGDHNTTGVTDSDKDEMSVIRESEENVK